MNVQRKPCTLLLFPVFHLSGGGNSDFFQRIIIFDDISREKVALHSKSFYITPSRRLLPLFSNIVNRKLELLYVYQGIGENRR